MAYLFRIATFGFLLFGGHSLSAATCKDQTFADLLQIYKQGIKPVPEDFGNISGDVRRGECLSKDESLVFMGQYFQMISAMDFRIVHVVTDPDKTDKDKVCEILTRAEAVQDLRAQGPLIIKALGVTLQESERDLYYTFKTQQRVHRTSYVKVNELIIALFEIDQQPSALCYLELP